MIEKSQTQGECGMSRDLHGVVKRNKGYRESLSPHRSVADSSMMHSSMVKDRTLSENVIWHTSLGEHETRDTETGLPHRSVADSSMMRRLKRTPMIPLSSGTSSNSASGDLQSGWRSRFFGVITISGFLNCLWICGSNPYPPPDRSRHTTQHTN